MLTSRKYRKFIWNISIAYPLLKQGKTYPAMRENIGEKIKTIRDKYNLSQERFAKKIGLSGKTISAYETGRTIPPLRILEKIVDTYQSPYIDISDDIRNNLNQRLEIIESEMFKLKKLLKENLSL